MTTTPDRLPTPALAFRRPRPLLFRSATLRWPQPVASPGVDGITGPVAGIDTAGRQQPRRPHQSGVVVVLLAVLTVLLCAACSTPEPSPREKTMDARAELAARPTLEEMTARYDEMLQRIRDRLDTELGPFTWYEADPRSWGTCGGDFSDLEGHTTSPPLWAFDSNIPDDQWPRAQRIVADITAEYGFATGGLQINTSGRHLTHGFDTALGAHYRFGTHVATTLGVSSGCHRSTNPTPWARAAGTPESP
jgi:hypothetical protein